MKTKTIFGIFAALIVLLALAVAPVAAAKYQELSSIQLVEKDGDWKTVPDGITGSFKPVGKTDSVMFSAEDLSVSTDYILISYSEPWGTKSNVIGGGKSETDGELEFQFRYSNLQKNLICNPYPTSTSDEYSGVGAKLWLVPASDFDVNSGTFTAWNPANYLFESKLFSTECSLPSVTLVEKDDSWQQVFCGAKGTMSYKSDNSAFGFSGKGLEAGQEYALISYSEPWGTKSEVFGTSVADAEGKINIGGESMPFVCNPYPTLASNEYSGTGSKIWLVPVSDFDVATGMFTAWNPANYLFETELINEGCDLPSVDLAKKDPDTWAVISTNGKLVYKADDTAFVFKANSLVAGTPYSLISYTEIWGSPNGILGTGTADGSGNVQILGSSIPLICNHYSDGEYIGQSGAKIWLVPSTDLKLDGSMAGFNPTTYLFEKSLIPMTTC
jgi:hypothetical protein